MFDFALSPYSYVDSLNDICSGIIHSSAVKWHLKETQCVSAFILYLLAIRSRTELFRVPKMKSYVVIDDQAVFCKVLRAMTTRVFIGMKLYTC